MNKYNGWRNYGTWLIYTWLSNDDMVFESVPGLEAYIEYTIDSTLPSHGLIRDAAMATLSDIDYHSIVEHMTE